MGPLRDWERLSPSLHLAGASDVGRWKNVASELHRRGYSDDELKKIFRLNLVTLFKQVLKS